MLENAMESTGNETQAPPAKTHQRRTRAKSKERKTRQNTADVSSEMVQQSAVPKRQKPNPYNLKEQWFLLRLNAPADPNEGKDVSLGHNGLIITIVKGKWTPVNAVFVDKLTQAEQPVFSNEPGEAREPMGFKSRFNFQGPFPIDETTYERLRAIAKTRDLTHEEVSQAIGFTIR